MHYTHKFPLSFRLLQLITIFCLSLVIRAQNLVPQITELSTEDGFSDMNWNTVLQDSRGFVWIGTNYGLNRYDGYEVTSYTQIKNNLQANLISTIVEDNKGYIWIGYPILYDFNSGGAKGIDILDPITKKIVPIEKKFKKLPFLVSELTFLKNSSVHKQHIWIGTKNGEIYYYNGQEFKLKYTHFTSLPINNIIECPNQTIWVKINGFPIYTIYAISSNGEILDKISPFKNNLNDYLKMITSRDSNDLILHSSSKSFYIKKIGFPLEKVIAPKYNHKQLTIYEPLKQFWAWEIDSASQELTQYINIYDYNLQFISKIRTPASFLKTPFFKGFIPNNDNANGSWLVPYTDHKGYIIYMNTSPFHKKLCAEEEEALLNYYARGMLELPNNEILYAGTIFLKDKTSVYSSSNILNNGLNLLEDDNHNIWFSREDKELYKVCLNSKKQWAICETYAYPKGQLKENLVGKLNGYWGMHQDKNGRIWLGHNLGLSYVDTTLKQLILYQKYNGFDAIKKGLVYHFHENDDGIWIASQAGLFLLDSQKGLVAHYHSHGEKDNYLPYDHIAHIHEDEDGFFWIASKGGGLIKWHPKTKEHRQYTTEDGLSHNIVYAVYQDAYNNLWMSSDRGIMRFNKTTELINIYLPRNGIAQEEFNTKAHLQTKDGTIYFGGIAGVTVFHPKDFQYSSKQKETSLQISSVLKRNESTGDFEEITAEVLTQNTIRLAPTDKSFLIKLALLDFQNSKANKYAYKINGLDQNWTYINQPEIRINSLPYGNYTFITKAQGSNGSWAQQRVRIQLEILRPFYLHWWFILASISFCLLCIYALVKRQTKQLNARKIELEQEVLKRTKKIEEDKKTIEEQAADLRALDELKSRFFANISHELRTPLTLILGPISYLLSSNSFDESLTRKYLKTMGKNGKNLLLLIEEILDLSKLDADKLEVHEEEVNLLLFLRRIFTAFDAQAEYLGIHNNLVYQLDKNLQVLLDANKVEKIINNLLSNALKFTPRGASISMQVTQLEHTFCIKVIDKGQGIHPKDLAHIFERFYQSKQANQIAQGGTGIGLALSHELATLMKGSLTAQSTLGQGTSFQFLFPAKIVHSVQDNSTVETTENETLNKDIHTYSLPDNLKILVVEDNDDMRAFLVELLTPFYNLASVGNGLKALEYLEEHPNTIDLIISDLMMPEMDGFELLKRVKADNSLRKIPLIMLTARAGQKDKLTALTIGVDSYLTKPFVMEELLAQVSNTLYNYHQRKTWQLELDPEEENNLISTEDSTPTLSLEDQEWIKTVEDYTLKNLSNSSFNVSQLYLEMNMTDRTFRRNLKRITGMSSVKYIRELRLQKARELLDIRKYNSIQQVCAAVGFGTPHYFTKQFKDRFGKLPTDYLT